MNNWEVLKQYIEIERRKTDDTVFDAIMNNDAKTAREQQIKEDALRWVEQKIKEIETGVTA